MTAAIQNPRPVDIVDIASLVWSVPLMDTGVAHVLKKIGFMPEDPAKIDKHHKRTQDDNRRVHHVSSEFYPYIEQKTLAAFAIQDDPYGKKLIAELVKIAKDEPKWGIKTSWETHDAPEMDRNVRNQLITRLEKLQKDIGFPADGLMVDTSKRGMSVID